jgi:hypothetical protein
MVIAESSGNEPWIFRVSEPGELVGAHRQRMAAALGAGEPIRYLLYSPSWQGRGRHFGIDGAPGSHALAATDRRFIVTRDGHDGSPATATSIPFANLIAVEKGSALLLAWFVARFVDDGGLRRFTILHKSTGAHHFDEAIRLWRETLPSMDRSPDLPPDEHWKSVPRFLYYEIEPLLLETERLHASLHSAQRWAERRRFFGTRYTFVQPWASALFADRSIVAGIAEQPLEPNMHAFGANVVIVPYHAITGATFVERSVQHLIAHELRIELARGGCTTSLAVPFDGNRAEGEAVAVMVRGS